MLLQFHLFLTRRTLLLQLRWMLRYCSAHSLPEGKAHLFIWDVLCWITFPHKPKFLMQQSWLQSIDVGRYFDCFLLFSLCQSSTVLPGHALKISDLFQQQNSLFSCQCTDICHPSRERKWLLWRLWKTFGNEWVQWTLTLPQKAICPSVPRSISDVWTLWWFVLLPSAQFLWTSIT